MQLAAVLFHPMRNCHFSLGLYAALLLLPTLTDRAYSQESPAPAPEQVIPIGTLHGKMKYDVELFQVKPGARVKLVFKNTDEMQHNIVICQPGENVAIEVAQKAWALGEEATKKQFVPDDPRVLFHTRVVDPQAEDTITFQAPQQEGDYPYVCTLPGHAYLMNGIMRVGEVTTGLRDLAYEYYQGEWDRLPDFTKLEPRARGKIASNMIDLSAAAREDHFAFVFTGMLHVPQDGEYTFYLNSDDGSRIIIGDQPVVTFDGIHAANGPRNGKIQLTKGAHLLRVEYFEGKHGQQLDVAWEGPGVKTTVLSHSGESAPVDHRHHLQASEKALVVRAFVDGGPPRAISVGLPGRVNYCFDADSSAVVFGWSGDFLDVGPDRGRNEGDRGGGWCKILGEKFSVGFTAFPLRFGDAAKVPQVRFGGYRRTEVPEFFMTADGVGVKQIVRAAPEGAGLQYEFQLEQVPGDVFFVLEPGNLRLASSAGTWNGGTLRVPAADAKKFTVTITR
jgi:azurin